jgi:hypothetical protein
VANLDTGNYIKDVQIMDMVTSNQVTMVYDLELRSSSDTYTVAALDSTSSVASLTAGISVEASQPSNGQTTVRVTGGSAGTRAIVVIALRKGVLNNNSGVPTVNAGSFSVPVLARSFPWDVAGLVWTAVTDDVGNSPTSYKVYRGTDLGGPYAEIGSTASVTYTDATASAGTTYYYVVTAADVGRESAESNEQSATPIVNASEKSLNFAESDSSLRLNTSSTGDHDWRRIWTVPHATNNTVTASVWVKLSAWVGASTQPTFFSIGRGPYGAGTEEGLGMEISDGTHSPHFTLYDRIETNKKSWGLAAANYPTLDEWFMFTASWDGTNNADCIKLYMNGVLETSPVKTSDADVTGMETPIGSGLAQAPGSIGCWASSFGRAQAMIYSVATWDTVLAAAEIAAMYNSGSGSNVDLTADSGDYVSSADLQDLWLPGKAATNAHARPYLSGPGFNYAGGTRGDDDKGNMEAETPDPSTPHLETSIPDGT